LTRPGLFAAAIVAAVTVGAAGQEAARFRTTAEAVLVDVQVMRGGKPISGLTDADFELRDSGVLQRISSVSFADVPVSVLLALDVSGSVRGDRLARLKDAAASAIGALGSSDQVALLTFSDRIALRSGWTSDRGAVAAAVREMDGSGSTSLMDAIFTTTALRDQAAGRVLIIAFTDGRDTTSWLDGKDVTAAALRSDAVVYAVSSGPPAFGADRERVILGPRTADERFEEDPRLYPYAFLGRVTSQTGGELIRVDSTTALAGVFAGIVRQFKSRYLLTYAPTGARRGGWHPIEVKLKNTTGTVTARRGYYR
jgi:VWFA-related protein